MVEQDPCKVKVVGSCPTAGSHKMKVIKSWHRWPKIRVLFAWTNLWIGIHWDKANFRLYIFPIPMFGVVMEFAPVPIGFSTIESAREERELIVASMYHQAASYRYRGFGDRTDTLEWHAQSIENCDHGRI